MSVLLGVGITAVVAIVTFFAVSGIQDGSVYVANDQKNGSDNTHLNDTAKNIPTADTDSEPALVMIPTPYDGSTGEPSREPAAPTQVSLETFVGNGSPFLGSASAPVVLVEFGDYQCHFCNVFFEDTKDLIHENYVEPGKVRMIFKDFHIIGPDSVDASHGAHCAGDQGLFWEYHDVLYENWAGENTGWASYENLVSFASGMSNMDINVWEQCMEVKPHSQKILTSNNDARLLGLDGTPSFFVMSPDGQVMTIIGAESYNTFANIFDTALEGTDSDNN